MVDDRVVVPPEGTHIAGEAPDAEPTDEATITDDSELERTLGLTGGLAIGNGRTIGAGSSVVPGPAGAEVGTAAASFAVGEVGALLVVRDGAERLTSVEQLASVRAPTVRS